MSETLSRQHTNAQSARFSIAADNQLRTTLETGLHAALGAGVLAKGRVTKTAALAVEVETGTQFFTEGVALTLGSAAGYSGLANGTNYLWGLITRTARDRNTPTAVDTWALVLSHGASATPATAQHILLAIITAAGGTITAIENAPAGKYLKGLAVAGQVRDTVAAGAVTAIDSGYQIAARNKMTIRGTAYVRGYGHIRGRD